MKSPQISIILTSFNHAKYLRESINSALTQTFTDFELIIWDDASTDNSWEIIQSYQDPRIKAFRNEVQKRGVYGLNKAISEVALGEYIAIHHSDDIWEKEKLEKQIGFLNCHKKYGAVFTDVFFIDEKGFELTADNHFYGGIFKQQNKTRHEWLRYFFEDGNALCHPSVLIRRKIYKDVGLYRVGLGQLADFDMWVRLALKYEIHVLPDQLVRYRIRENNANASANTSHNRTRTLFEHFLILNHYNDIIKYSDAVKVFPEVKKYIASNSLNVRYGIAMAMLETKSFSFKKQFALNNIFSILNNQKSPTDIILDGRDFIALSGELDPLQVRYVEDLNQTLTYREAQLAEKVSVITDKEGVIADLNQKFVSREGRIQELEARVTEKERVIAALTDEFSTLEGQILGLAAQISEKEGMIFDKNSKIIDLENQLLEKKEAFAGLSSEFNTLRESLSCKVQQIKGLQGEVTEKNDTIDRRDHELQHIRAYLDLVKSSWSWRLTAPLRIVQQKVKSVDQTLKRYRLAASIIWTHRKTGIFDPTWYLQSNPDVKASGMNPLIHFALHGVHEGRSPHGLFISEEYLIHNADVRLHAKNAIEHYMLHGWKEGRVIHHLFDAEWYLNSNNDVNQSRVNPMVHYLHHGGREGRSPSLMFDSRYYLESNPDILEAEVEPLSHYIHHGWREGRRAGGRLNSQDQPFVDKMNRESPEYKKLLFGYFSKKASPIEYQHWINRNEPSLEDLLDQRDQEHEIPNRPLISIILPVYKLPLEFLKSTMLSLQGQTYTNWEACVAYAAAEQPGNLEYLQKLEQEDPRIRVLVMESNMGISGNSNAALSMAKGDFIALLDHDDELTPFALYQMVQSINENPIGDFFYSDKDQIEEDGKTRLSPLFKPAWSPEILYSVNYLTHFNLMRRELVNQVDGFRSVTDGAQDWDIFLRVCEQAREIVRVSGVHYHWRIHPASTSTGIASKPYALDGQERALRDHLERLKLPASLEPSEDSGFRIVWKIPKNLSIHIIVDMTQQNDDNLSGILESIASEVSDLQYIHAVVTVLYMGLVSAKERPETSISIDRLRVENRECIGNDKTRGMRDAINGHISISDAVIVVSGVVKSLSKGWLGELIGWVSCAPNVGFASALILDKHDLVVEAGSVVDSFGNASPMFRGSPLRHWGILGGPLWYRNCRASHPWVVAFSATTYQESGGLQDHWSWGKSFINLCVSIHDTGKRGMVTPHARATLGEAMLPPVPEFHSSLKDDPYFHPSLSSVSPLTLDLEGPDLEKKTSIAPKIDYSAEAMGLASVIGCSSSDLLEHQQHPERIGKGEGAGWFNWYLPGFSNPYYGGVMTILRFADFLHRKHGIRQRFLICGNDNAGRIKTSITSAYPELDDSEVLILDSDEAISQIPASDYSSATLWTTAYVLLRINNTGLKFYFVQDCEPLFYPAGSTYAQAEMTYRFGFYGICNTETLHGMYEGEYGGKATYFKPQVDSTVFYGSIARSESGPKRIFFYGRPGHARNGFELTILGMKILKARLGDKVEIICAGAEWDPEEFGLQGVVTNLGLLGYQETGELYRSCHIGFVMMMTKHPSYLPFELMACGALLVSNVNSSNAWLLKDGENCLLAQPSAVTIADRLEYAVRHYNEIENIRKAGRDLIEKEHNDWSNAFDGVWGFVKTL